MLEPKSTSSNFECFGKLPAIAMETNIIGMNSGLGSDFRHTNMLQSFVYIYLFGKKVFKSFRAILTFMEMHKETNFCVTTNILITFSWDRVKFFSLLMCA